MSNPLIREELYSRASGSMDVMTLDGVIYKTLFLGILTVGTAIYSWFNIGMISGLLIPVIIVSIVVALIISFAPKSSPFLAPIYAVLQGLVIGSISLHYELQFPGIITQAVGLTFGVFFIMLYCFKMRWIRVTEKFRSIMMVGLMAIFVLYLISLLGTLTQWFQVPYIHQSGIIGIGFSVFVVIMASFTLLLDFDDVEKALEFKAPKYLEWYTAFGILSTLIWLYIEMLRLLSKINSDD